MEKLYKWVMIRAVENYKDERYFIDQELRLNHYGIRTKVKIGENNSLELWVPYKDAEIAEAVITKEVKEIIDEKPDFYHVFDEQLKFKNKKLYENKYAIKLHFLSAKRYSWIGILVLILLLLFKFIKF